MYTCPIQVTVNGRRIQNDTKPVYLAAKRVGLSSSGQTLVGVEGYAVYHYSHTEGWPCILHAEGSTFSAMFILLMWEVIFCPGIPDVFRTPCQVLYIMYNWKNVIGSCIHKTWYNRYMGNFCVFLTIVEILYLILKVFRFVELC